MRIIGLNGRMGAGKDTVADRIEYLCGKQAVNRISFAGPLKESVAALFGITVGDVEWWKGKENTAFLIGPKPMTMRAFLQRYGSEAHRQIFGEHFWVEMGLGNLRPGMVNVITDVRFPNEAESIRDHGGEVWQIVGLNDREDDHASEQDLPPELVSALIINNRHDDNFQSIDNTLKFLLAREGVKAHG